MERALDQEVGELGLPPVLPFSGCVTEGGVTVSPTISFFTCKMRVEHNPKQAKLRQWKRGCTRKGQVTG